MRNLLLGLVVISLLVSGFVANFPTTDGEMLAAASAYTWWQEAEAGSRSVPMTTGQDTDASNCTFVYTENRDQGAVTFSLSVSQSAYYYIWARARGANERENSFFFSIDGGTGGVVRDSPLG